MCHCYLCICFFLSVCSFKERATSEIYTLSLHDALPICGGDADNFGVEGEILRVFDEVKEMGVAAAEFGFAVDAESEIQRSEEHTSELQSLRHLVCRLLLEKKKQKHNEITYNNQTIADRQ